MRTGAIFARGSCRALKWVALVGVLFALGAGQAAAQTTTGDTQELSIASVSIGGSTAKSVTVHEQTTVEVVVTLNAAVPDGKNDGNATGKMSSVDVRLVSDISKTVTAGKAEEADVTTDVGNGNIPSNASDDFGTISEGDKTFSFTLELEHDADAVDEEFELTFTLDNVQGAGQESNAGETDIDISEAESVMKTVTIDDDETQVYEFDVTTTDVKEGLPIMVELEADPPRPAMEDVTLNVFVEGEDGDRYDFGGSSSATAMFNDKMMDNEKFTINLKSKFDGVDGDREDDEITLLAYSSDVNPRTAEAVATVDITVMDIHSLPAVKLTLVDDDGEALDPQPESVMEGETIKIMLTAVNKDGKDVSAGEDLMVSLMPAGTASTQDYQLSVDPIAIDSGSMSSAAVSLMVEQDEDVGMEMLVFDAVVAGEDDNGTETRTSMGVLSLAIEDATEKLVWAKSQDDVYAALLAAMSTGKGDDGLNPGESFELMGSDLFEAAEGVTVDYAISSSNSDAASGTASGGMLTVMAESAGMADMTVTATATTASGVTIVAQTRPNVAQVMFEVEVEPVPLSFSLMGPEDMNLVEGGAAAVVEVMANRALMGDETAEISLMRDGASSAGMDDFTVEPEMVTLMAGDMTAEFMVMAVEDDMADGGAHHPEELILFKVIDGMQKTGMDGQSVKFYIWDMAVPALPLVAQLLLGGLLAVGGFRRYYRRR